MPGTNYQSHGRADLMRIYAAAVSAVDPRRVVARALDGTTPGAEFVPEMVARATGIRMLAVGKAAPGMAAEIAHRLSEKFSDGLEIAPASASTEALPGVRLMRAAHPLPDASSEAAGRAALEFVGRARAGDLLMFALSGGASAMTAVPANGVLLNDKIEITGGLLRSGATIRELNTVRKHLSAIKGGGLLRAVAPGVRVVSLILSDVPGNDLATIGSGPTAADPTTYSDAIAVLKRRSLWGRAPESIRSCLEHGAAGEIEETLKPDDTILTAATNIIVGDNRTAVDAAMESAGSLDYQVEHWRDLAGEANDLGRALANHLAAIERNRVCVVAGGEPVVTVKGTGRGGRAQQCALAMALEFARIQETDRRILALFAGTDGIDGPTDAAGAIVTPDTVARSIEAGLDALKSLALCDSYNFFKAIGDILITGPTGTNVADIFVGLLNY
jgi:glycerate 2-kinase